MTLPESNRSLWVETSAGAVHAPLCRDVRADVAVVGAGIFGLTTALLLQRAGFSVVMLEAASLCTGTSGYTTGKLSSLHQLKYASLVRRYGETTARIYGQANEAAIDQCESLVQTLAIECSFERRPAHVFTRDPLKIASIDEEAKVARDLGLPASVVQASELPFGIEASLKFEGQALFHVRRYCLGLASAFREAGGSIFEHTRAIDVKEATDECTVRTASGHEVRAKHAVLATLIPFLDRGAFFAKLRPMRSYVLAVRVAKPCLSEMHISADDPIRSLRPALDGRYVLVGGESHQVGHEPDTWARYRALEQFAREHFPVESIDYRWSAQDFVSFDGLPFIGRMPLTKHVLVGTGFGKWGLSLGTAAAMILRDRLCDAENEWAACFDATRVNVMQSIKEATLHGIDSGKRMVKDRLVALGGPDATELAPGQAAIATLNGQRVAAYRDPGGSLHAVSPVCTHLGCYVTWNPAETSWDCPCHGSRFGTDGRVLEGPAIRDLEGKGTADQLGE